MQHWLYLAIAIISEVIATSALKAAEGFTQPLPSLIVAIGYGIAFYCLSVVLRTQPVGIVYAIWSGVGMVLIALVGWLIYKQTLDLPAIVGMTLIVAGVIVLNVYSKTVIH